MDTKGDREKEKHIGEREERRKGKITVGTDVSVNAKDKEAKKKKAKEDGKKRGKGRGEKPGLRCRDGGTERANKP